MALFGGLFREKNAARSQIFKYQGSCDLQGFTKFVGFFKILFDFRRSDASNQWHYYLFGQILLHIVLYFWDIAAELSVCLEKISVFDTFALTCRFLFLFPLHLYL